MTLQTLVTIILIFFAILFFVAFLIITFFFGRQSVQDKADKGAVFVKTGLHVKGYKAKRCGQDKGGDAFIFGKNEYIFVPDTYKKRYFNDRRLIFINNVGELIASPFDDDKPLNDTQKTDLVYEICASHVGADGMRAMKGYTKMSFLYLIIAFIIGAGMVLGYQSFQEQLLKQQQAIQPAKQEIQITPK